MGGDTKQTLIPPEREIPNSLNSKLFWRIGIFLIIGGIIAGIFAFMASSAHSEYLESQSLYYEGSRLNVKVLKAEDDEDVWYETLPFEYFGKKYSKAFVELSKAEQKKVDKKSASYVPTPVDVAFWPSELEGPEPTLYSLGWIREHHPSDGKTYVIVAVLVMAISLILGLMAFFRLKHIYERGEEIWAVPVSEISYNSDTRMYSTRVSYVIDGKAIETPVRWKHLVIKDDDGNILGLVDPKKPRNFYPLNSKEARYLST